MATDKFYFEIGDLENQDSTIEGLMSETDEGDFLEIAHAKVTKEISQSKYYLNIGDGGYKAFDSFSDMDHYMESIEATQ